MVPTWDHATSHCLHVSHVVAWELFILCCLHDITLSSRLHAIKLPTPVHAWSATMFIRFTLSPWHHATTFLLYSQACRMPAPAMNHANSRDCHMTQQETMWRPRHTYTSFHHVTPTHIGLKPFSNSFTSPKYISSSYTITSIYTIFTFNPQSSLNHILTMLAIDLCLSQVKHQDIYIHHKDSYLY